MREVPPSVAVEACGRGLLRIESVVLALGVGLRVYLALVNGEANDDHLSVIRIIADQHRLPGIRDAWEGFQPKLYHVAVAILWDLSPFQSAGVQVRIAQFVSCAAGVATLFVVRRALRRRGLSDSIRVLTFSFVALNPTLIGLNAQATNDSFVILFATIALAQGAEFLRTGTRRAFILMTASVTLATLSKGNGLVVFVALAVTMSVALVRSQAVPGLSRRRLCGLGAIFLVTFFVLVGAFGAYRANYRDTGDPFAINAPRAPFPHLVEKTSVFRPGVESIAAGYFTFRFVDLLEHPWITNGVPASPRHRTSLWTQLYGRANSLHFAQFPPSWRNKSLLVLTVGRLEFVLALLPTALLLSGMFMASKRLIRPARDRRFDDRPRLIELLFVLTALGYVAFVVQYTVRYRDFSTMKAEFLFPGLLAYACIFGDELQRAAEWSARRPRLRTVACGALIAVLALYVLDAAILAVQLT
jgi:hypothetical protein